MVSNSNEAGAVAPDLGILPAGELDGPAYNFAGARDQASSASSSEPQSNLYQASPIKRSRATKLEVDRRRQALCNIVSTMKPMTVRQIFYQATVRGIVEKTEAGYTKVQTDLVLMRRAGELPYSWITDNT